MSEQSIEQKIQDAGLTAPRITPDHIENVIEFVQFILPEDDGGTLTFCILQLVNGFQVTGISACASPENYDEEVGKEIAYKEAKEKIWELEGYLLKQRLFEGAHS